MCAGSQGMTGYQGRTSETVPAFNKHFTRIERVLNKRKVRIKVMKMEDTSFRSPVGDRELYYVDSVDVQETV